jgi:pimeloyl-ACP methyl ester carboxylesterase
MVSDSATAVRRIQRAEGLSLIHEALALRDGLWLFSSGVIRGRGVPRGDGSPVVIVPGFLGSDRYLLIMYRWLRRIGYRPYYSGIGRNYDCPDLLVQRLLLTVEQANLETGRRVHIIGHSLGGTMARVVAGHAPQQVAHVITLGSPIQSANVHPFILAAKEVVRRRIHRAGPRRPQCYTEECECGFAERVLEPVPTGVKRHAIYTRSDGVVHWESCIEADPSLNTEVRSTHLGLAFNPESYRAIARLLAGGE